MRRTNLVFRLFVMAFVAIGLGTLMASPAAAQTTVQCQTVIDGEIDQQDCIVTIEDDGQCQVVLESGEIQQNIECSPEGCPQQLIDSEGNIFQFQCDGINVTPTATAAAPTAPTAAPTATTVAPTATTAAPTATTVAPTATTAAPTATTVAPTDVPATQVPPTAVVTPDVDDGSDDGADDGGQANPDGDDDGSDDGADDGGQANPDDDKEMEVSVLPSTGQGPDGGDSNSANMLLLGAMGAVLTLGAVAMRLRNVR